MGNCSTSSRGLEPGDHIRSARSGDIYQHHGIYVGDGMVIHWRPPSKKGNSSISCQKCGDNPSLHSGIIKTCLSCFCDDNSMDIICYDSDDCKSPDEVVKIATEFLQGIRSFGDYNFAFNNCEDFASFCKTGTKSSGQRTKGLTLATAVVGVAILGNRW